MVWVSDKTQNSAENLISVFQLIKHRVIKCQILLLNKYLMALRKNEFFGLFEKSRLIVSDADKFLSGNPLENAVIR